MRLLILLIFVAGPALAQEVTLFDNTKGNNQAAYDSANGCAWSGKGLFGDIYDLQIASDFDAPSDGYLTSVRGDFMCFLQHRPESLYLALFENVGGKPSETPRAEFFCADFLNEWFVDQIWGMEGMSLTATIPPNALPVTEGINWLVIQPVDLRPTGDWFYLIRDFQLFHGYDDYMRDGGRARGGYGTLEWRSAGELRFGRGTMIGKIVYRPTAPQHAVPGAAETVKGHFRSGDAKSLAANDDNYWIQGAAYDPGDPGAVLISQLEAVGYAAAADWASGLARIVQKTTSENTTYRIRALRNDGVWRTIAFNVPGKLQETLLEAQIPQPVSDFVRIDFSNRMRLELRNSTANRFAGFFRHSVDLVQWELVWK